MYKQLTLLLPLFTAFIVSLPTVNSTEQAANNNPNCIRKSRTSNRNYDDDLNDTEGRLRKRGAGAIRWRGKRVIYRIENMPECSEGLTVVDVKQSVDAAAAMWNSIPSANVLLVNADTLEDFEDKDIDIHISFLPCKHKIPTLKYDTDFDPCQSNYAHAIHYSDMHLNTYMTWTVNSDIHEKDVKLGDLVRPNLYSIVLHEFGHTLGLPHSPDPSSVMFAMFGGDRKHVDLALGEEDITKIQDLYPPELSCRDKSVFCKKIGTSVCEKEAQRRACPDTCGDCTCNSDTPDDYLKCTRDICSGESELKQLCKNTCNLCGEKCTELPDIDMITTSASFPVGAGTVISVSCKDGWEIKGDVKLTCVEGNEYKYGKRKPACTEEEEDPEELKFCADKSKKCKTKMRKGKKCKSKWMRKNCQKSCNQCPAS